MKILQLFIVFFIVLVSFSCQPSQQKETVDPTEETKSVEFLARTKGYNEFRNPYFGQTHQHTGWSFDAAILDVKLGPDNAYKHARGDKVMHPAGYEVQLKVPLDFLSVTDHAEYLGVLLQMYDPIVRLQMIYYILNLMWLISAYQ